MDGIVEVFSLEELKTILPDLSGALSDPIMITVPQRGEQLTVTQSS